MSEKPKKRLVSKGLYVRLMGKKMILYAPSLLVLATAFVIFVFEIEYKGLMTSPIAPYLRALTGSSGMIVTSAIIIGGSLLCLLCIATLDKAKSIEQVERITSSNIHLLPSKESLVRASSLPPSQHAELLRSPQEASETPAEELLRATQKNPTAL